MKIITLSGGSFGGTQIQVDESTSKSMFGKRDEQGMWVYDLSVSATDNEAVFIGMAGDMELTPEQAAQLATDG